MRNLKLIKIISVVIIFICLVIPLLFLQGSMTTMSQSHHAMSVSDCPFMNQNQSLCPLNLLFYISVWRSIFSSFFPSIKLILFFSIILIATIAKFPLIFYDKPPLYFNRIKTKIKILYEELFSNGLLNPKVF